jgi:hypothetical protein
MGSTCLFLLIQTKLSLPFEVEGEQLHLHNSLGQLIKTVRILDNDFVEVLDVRDYPSGLYILTTDLPYVGVVTKTFEVIH